MLCTGTGNSGSNEQRTGTDRSGRDPAKARASEDVPFLPRSSCAGERRHSGAEESQGRFRLPGHCAAGGERARVELNRAPERTKTRRLLLKGLDTGIRQPRSPPPAEAKSPGTYWSRPADHGGGHRFNLRARFRHVLSSRKEALVADGCCRAAARWPRSVQGWLEGLDKGSSALELAQTGLAKRSIGRRSCPRMQTEPARLALISSSAGTPRLVPRPHGAAWSSCMKNEQGAATNAADPPEWRLR